MDRPASVERRAQLDNCCQINNLRQPYPNPHLSGTINEERHASALVVRHRVFPTENWELRTAPWTANSPASSPPPSPLK